MGGVRLIYWRVEAVLGISVVSGLKERRGVAHGGRLIVRKIGTSGIVRSDRDGSGALPFGSLFVRLA